MARDPQKHHLHQMLALIDQAHKLAMLDHEHVLAFILQTASLEASERIEKPSVAMVSRNHDEN